MVFGKQIVKAIPKKNKYGNIVTTLNGIKFDSKAESLRYALLTQRQRAGMISDLKIQQSFDFHYGEKKICTYFSDFSYQRDGQLVVEDVKNPALAKSDSVFCIKKRMMRIFHGIDVVVIPPDKVLSTW